MPFSYQVIPVLLGCLFRNESILSQYNHLRSRYLSPFVQRIPIELADFTSDGCSLFINGTFDNLELWKECCTLHDLAYWRGRTEAEREQDDLAFKAYVEKKTGNAELAELMHQAVRARGEPYLPSWYRWG